jgi:inner membrane protein
MDSLTQIVLGASVGEAVLGRKIGNKAMLYGAIAGTIPDLDVLSSYFTDTVTALEFHRGFTHSVFFSIVMAPIFSWLVTRYESYQKKRAWTWFFFWIFLTHPILDSYTTWGTQLFWPADLRLAFKTIFVIDPIYTLPFLSFVILTMFHKRTSRKRRLYNLIGLSLSTAYLVLTFVLKTAANVRFEKALDRQDIAYEEFETRPSAMNTILWNVNVKAQDHFLLGDHSFFDTQPVEFSVYPNNYHLLGDLKENEKVQRMMEISQGWFTIIKKDGSLYYNDLRFGLLSLEKGSQDFVFQYRIDVDEDRQVTFTEMEKRPEDGKQLLDDLWERIQGN